jgi:hypothetical protein
MEQQDSAGKKIFFLYPHSVIQGEVFDILISNGYEAYAVRDHKRARRLVELFPTSIMFINIDEALPEKEWEAYIREIQEAEKTKECRLGILSYNTDQKLMAKYLMDMSIPCGYVTLKLGMQESVKIILNVLQANEARGRRKFIRAACDDDRNAVMNFQDEMGTHFGKLLDISIAGFAAKIEKLDSYPPNSKITNVQLKLRGGIVMADAILMGKRQGDRDVWILLFVPTMKEDYKAAIHHFIKESLQRYIDKLEV